MILFPLNEYIPISPIVPLCLPLYVAPSDSAASSIIGTLYLSQISFILSKSALCPYRLTTITAFGI